MGMTDKNLCDSCTNIGCMFQSGIVRTECAFYIPPHIEPDNCGNYVGIQSTVEAIPKDQYENRLKADMVAMLTEIQLEIEEASNEEGDWIFAEGEKFCSKLIQQKIDKLKELCNG